MQSRAGRWRSHRARARALRRSLSAFAPPQRGERVPGQAAVIGLDGRGGPGVQDEIGGDAARAQHWKPSTTSVPSPLERSRSLRRCSGSVQPRGVM